MEAVEGGYQRAPASPDEGVDVASRPSYARRAAAAGVLVAGALLASGAVARGSTLSVDATTELGSLKSAYCNLTISKQTCQGECGSYVRLALNGTNEGEHVPCFGLHMVNAKDRPAGNVSVSEVETHFDARLTDMSTYDPFMDISMMFYANSLQTYVEAFERDGIPYMLLKWRDNLINFELVSSLAPRRRAATRTPRTLAERNGASERPIFEDPTVRMSHIALSFAGSAPPGSDDLVPLAISGATSDMATVTEYYTTILSADVDYDSEDSDDTIDGYTMKIFRLPGAPMPVKVVQRHAESNYAFGYMDNHFDLTQYDYPVDEWTTRLSDYGYKWHCNRVGFGSLDIYATKPSGDVIQLDGYLTDPGIDYMLNLGCYNVSNVLFHMCSQGKWAAVDDGFAPRVGSFAPARSPTRGRRRTTRRGGGPTATAPAPPGTCTPPAGYAHARVAPVSPRRQWVDAEGVFGGASAIQAIALSYGVYVSQGVAAGRADGGGHGAQTRLRDPAHERSGKAPDGSANLGYYRRFDTLVDTLYLRGNCSKADDKRGEATPASTSPTTSAWRSRATPRARAARVLALDKDYEPDTDVGDVAALELSATVTVRDVRLNGRYVLFRFDKGTSGAAGAKAPTSR
ncbi:hypothetical protein JL720_6553 [Aureococcus anophagefferens]|nr:hypothetical protein JL720_6553 [Aureococcus anophagefferens]